jgi:hypothetical protein
MRDNAPEDCPDVELGTNGGRSPEWDLAVWKGRRRARTSFQGATRKASPSVGRGKRLAEVDPAELLGAVIGLTPEAESRGAVVWRSSDRSGGNDPEEVKNLLRRRSVY